MNLLASNYGFTRLYLKKSPTSTTHTLERTLNRLHQKLQHQEEQSKEFDTIEAMLNHVTVNWMDHFVTCDVNSVPGIAVLRRRPFFLVLSVEAPMMIRYRRCVARCREHELEEPTLEQFVEMTDDSLYMTSTAIPNITSTLTSALSIPPTSAVNGFNQSSTSSAIGSPPSLYISPSPSPSPPTVLGSPAYKLLSLSDLALLNTFSDLDSLLSSLTALDITNPDLLRPSWDSYFMYLANLAARRSNCMKRRVGCVLVRDRRVIATGYNGTPKNLENCNNGGCSRCNQGTPCGRGLDRCLCMHAEENALLEAGRERIGSGSTIYCNTCPCLGCAIKIVQVGVSVVVYSESYGMDELTADVFRKAGVELRQHATPVIKLDQSNP
ncbi:Deoxycytidine monophosphate (dCMP) deaminase [Haplosporangium sp. Z 11]|nr:Deoxycytidine monophosphate (dCMP) deaminase [Haplosporangium sp. Z 11]